MATKPSLFHANPSNSPDSAILVNGTTKVDGSSGPTKVNGSTKAKGFPKGNGPTKTETDEHHGKDSKNIEKSFHFHANGTTQNNPVVKEEKIVSDAPPRREITIVLPDPRDNSSPKARRHIPIAPNGGHEMPKPILKKSSEKSIHSDNRKDGEKSFHSETQKDPARGNEG